MSKEAFTLLTIIGWFLTVCGLVANHEVITMVGFSMVLITLSVLFIQKMLYVIRPTRNNYKSKKIGVYEISYNREYTTLSIPEVQVIYFTKMTPQIYFWLENWCEESRVSRNEAGALYYVLLNLPKVKQITYSTAKIPVTFVDVIFTDGSVTSYSITNEE